MATIYWTDVNGRKWPVCSCLKAWLPVYQAELLRVGVIKYGLDVYQTIGGAVASGGTHVSGQCVDTAQTTTTAISIARQMGADASWHRPYNWDNKNGMAHAHLNLRGCPHGSAAADRQYSSTFSGVDYGKNGLANGAPDPGPKPLSKRTYTQGIAWAKARQTPSTTLRLLSFNFPGPDKLPNTDARVAAGVALVKAATPDVIALNELIGRKGVGVPSDFAAQVHAAMGSGWALVIPTTNYNENYIMFNKATIGHVRQYPDTILPSAAGGRHITRDVLRHLASGRVFAFGATHLVNGVDNGAERVKQADVAMGAMREVSNATADCPIFIAGDMNRSLDLPAFINGGLVNARRVAKATTGAQYATFTNYAKTVPSTNDDNQLDHIYVPSDWTVNGYRNHIDTDSAGKFRQPRPSDHFPIVISVSSH